MDRKNIVTIRAVSLDVDDTLVDYEASARSALVVLIGHDNAWPVWQCMTDEHVARVFAGEFDYDTMRRERTRAFFARLGEFLDDSEVARLEDRRLAVMQRQWQTFDDSLPCLDWLRGVGLPIVAITNAAGSHQRDKLASVGLIDFFDHIVIAGELGVAKPDPVIFHTACLALGVRPAEVVHIGDRLDVDAVAARDAGMRGIWLDRCGCAGTSLPDGVTAISSLAELPELLVCDMGLDGQ